MFYISISKEYNEYFMFIFYIFIKLYKLIYVNILYLYNCINYVYIIIYL